MSDLMVLDMGGLALPFDATQAAELTKNITAGFGGNFKKSARLSMGNSGDWELIDSEGEIHDLGREVNIVIVDQREGVSRIHYAQSFDEMKASGEFAAPDCQSFDGVSPDESVEHKYAGKCKDCKAFEQSGQLCGYYRRVVAVLAYEDGTFSDPFVFEPKAKSLFDKTVVKERFGSYGWYMNVLASQKRNGVPMPIPTQAVVTKCMPMPKMEVATIKFGISSNAAGGFWTLSKEQFDEILKLKDSDEVKDMLKPFNAATLNPSSAGIIPVKDVTDEPKQEKAPAKQAKPEPVEAQAEQEETTVKQETTPTKKVPPKKSPPAPKVAKKTVVLGMEHPDVKNSADYDYDELVEWAKDADEADVKEFLAENFPQALEPVEVDEPAEVEQPKKAPPRRSLPKTKKEAVDTADENVVDTSGASVDPALAAQAEELAAGLDDFDD